MTPVLWLDPVAAAAIAAGLTPAVGLGQLVCANDCARFGGKVHGHTRGSNWDWVPCPDCRGTGLVQPSGPQTMLIGATADMSDDLVYDYQDHLAAVDGPADVVWTSIGPHWGWHLAIRPAGEEWTSSNTTYRPIHPASILGTATVELVPVMDESQGTGRGVWTVSDAKARVRPDGSSVYPRLLLATDDVTADLVDISAALPFGSWTPGGLALIVTAVEAPAVPVRLSVADNRLTVSLSGDEASADATIDAKATDAPTFALNPRYLLDALAAHVEETITFRLVDPLKPIQWDNGPSRCLLMPVKLGVS